MGNCRYLGIIVLLATCCLTCFGMNEETMDSIQPRRVLVLAERGGLHEGFTATGLQWLDEQKERLNLELTVLETAEEIPQGEIGKYRLVLQLNHPPYAWSEAAQRDMEEYIDSGRGGFIGFHHATLLGEFDGYPMWEWFSDFMGKIRYKNYIADKTDGTVQVEDREHPVMKDVPGTFVIPDDEWYTYETNPRPNVHVLAHVDECSYSLQTDVKMGDHPVVWTNPAKKARNVYFQFGHSRLLFENAAFVTLFENAIRWTLGDTDPAPAQEEEYAANYARAPRFKALVHYEPHAEEAHVQFDKQAIEFLHKLTYGEGWLMDVTTSLADYPYEKLKEYSIVVSLNAAPGDSAQRADRKSVV